MRDKSGKFLPGCQIRLGTHHSDEARAKMRKNHSRFMLGKTLPEKTRVKISIAKRGQRNPQFLYGLDTYRSKHWLTEKYVDEELSLSEIANVVGVSAGTIYKWLCNTGIPRRKCGSRIGEKNHNWHGGQRRAKKGYIRIYSPKHPRRGPDDCVPEHVIVVENFIGRILKRGWTIHHIDENKHNNALENLYIFNTIADHSRYHQMKRRNSTDFTLITESNLSMYR